MKYCVKCGNPMDDAMQFCQKCGAKCVTPTDEANYPPQQDQDNYAEYWGLHYKDIESGNEIELTPDGVHIFHSKGMKQFRFDKTIPYTEIIDVNSVRATALKSGYLSIITATEGITGKATRQQLLFNQNTVLFTKKTEPEAERIYRAIEDICSAPPASTIHTTYYESSTGKQEVVSSPSLKNPVKPRKKTGCLIPILAVFVIATIAAIIGSNSGNGNHSEDSKPEASTPVIIDVEQYGNISGNELIALVGEPDEISQSTCQGAFDIPCVYYEYGNASILGEVSFVLVNDQVVRFTSYSDYPYENKDEVLTQFGINKESSCAVAADTDVALRYRCPSAKVDDFWINLIDGDTFGFLQITYDMEYFEEWYLPLTSDEEIKYKSDAELTMKSLLSSPKTADFPWYDWEYGKNLFYILVSSYVDSENAFGAEIRNTFTFIYSRLTDEIVLAIVNDEVVVNNGYVAVDELIQQLYDEMKKATGENSNTETGTESATSAGEENSGAENTLSSDLAPTYAATPTPSTEMEVTEDPIQYYNTVEQLEEIMRSSCAFFNAGENKTLKGTLSFNIKNTTEIELFYDVSEWVYSDTEYLVDVVQDEILDYVIEDLNAADLPEIVTVSISASYSLSSTDNSWDNGGDDLDGICTSLTDEELADLEAASGN